MNEVTVYHYTPRENVPTILKNGLLNQSKFNAMSSRLRVNASYHLLSPSHDVMGYAGDEGYACLQVTADPAHCVVADMDLISAAYVNYIQEQANESVYDYRKLVALYDASAVALTDYENGMFRAPEVILRRHVPPDKITLAAPADRSDAYAGNRGAYNAAVWSKLSSCAPPGTFRTMTALIEALTQSGLIIKLAENEDATGPIRTYALKGRDGFFTVEDTYAY